MKKTILAILAITSLLLLHAQENAAPQAEQQEQPAVTSQKRLRELTLAELDQKNHRAREAGEIAAKFKNISTIQNVDLRITEYLRLQKRIAKLQKEIQNANSRQADLAEEIRAGLLDTKLSLQESQRLVECRQYMDEFARAQRLMALQLKKLSDNIQGLILKMPPPPTYTTRSGLKMRLVGTLPNALYISENCVPDALFDEVRSAKALQREPFISADYRISSSSRSFRTSTPCRRKPSGAPPSGRRTTSTTAARRNASASSSRPYGIRSICFPISNTRANCRTPPTRISASSSSPTSRQASANGWRRL